MCLGRFYVFRSYVLADEDRHVPVPCGLSVEEPEDSAGDERWAEGDHFTKS